MNQRINADNDDFSNAQYASIRLDDIRTDWRVSMAKIRLVARTDPGAQKLRALVDSVWDGIVADAGKYGIGFNGPGFSREVREMLSGTGYIYTTRNFDVFRLADIIEIRDARLDVVSGRDCVRFVVVADAHDGPFESAEILQWLSEEGRPSLLSSNFELRRQEIASVADELEAYAHDVEATVLRKLNAIVEQLKARGRPNGASARTGGHIDESGMAGVLRARRPTLFTLSTTCLPQGAWLSTSTTLALVADLVQ